MATYKAEIKTVEAGSRFTVTMESGSASNAKQQIEALYDPIYIYNLRECKGGGSSSDGNAMGWIFLIAILFGIWFVIEYWWIVAPLGVIGLIAWIMKFFSD